LPQIADAGNNPRMFAILSRARLRLGAAIAVVAILFLAGYGWLQPQRRLAARVAAELDTARDERVMEVMKQLAAFGEHGLPHLAAALKHERPEVASAARTVLSEELDRWQLLPPKTASKRIACLAEELSRGIEACSPMTRRMASDLATRILLWPVDAAAINQPKLISNCERVLVAVRAREQPTILATHLETAGISPRGVSELSPYDEALDLPGGGLPIEMSNVPALPREEQAQPRALPSTEEVELSPVIPPGEEPRRFVPQASTKNDGHPADETLDNIHRLVSADSEVREAAEQKLIKTGFGVAQLEVARRFADPRPEARRKLADDLSRQSVIDPRPWLLKLLEDSDRSVRLKTATILSTTSDPQLLHQLRQRAVVENDPEVRAMLDRVRE
jgi:hypothetical protein